MANSNETIADIIAEMRNYSNTCNDGYHTDYGVIRTDMRNFADRLEAALKREKAAIEADALAVGGLVEASRSTTENSSAVGDAAKLREALIAALPIMRHCPFTHYNDKEIDSVVAMIERALAAPPRNCDIYTDANSAHREWRKYRGCHAILAQGWRTIDAFDWLLCRDGVGRRRE